MLYLTAYEDAADQYCFATGNADKFKAACESLWKAASKSLTN